MPELAGNILITITSKIRRISVSFFRLSDIPCLFHLQPAIQAQNRRSTLYRYSCGGGLTGKFAQKNTRSGCLGFQDYKNYNIEWSTNRDGY
ncbi:MULTISPECIES: hypothetical protein [unclassified Pseudomonas]|uniref:hypothetical protein n=1 Tax=unclassified Pseudomonas TaxID=196821 RepID=UPI00385E6B98